MAADLRGRHVAHSEKAVDRASRDLEEDARSERQDVVIANHWCFRWIDATGEPPRLYSVG